MSSPDDVVGDAIERLEWNERKEDSSPGLKLRQVTRRTALTGGAAGLAALALEAAGGAGTASAASGSSASSIFGVKGGYKFTMVNHVTTNIFFTPTQNGAADACKLLGCSYQWTGSQTSSSTDMVNSINTAISAKVDGIATTLIDPKAFNTPVQKALSAGIPVVAYNADEPTTGRLAYIGQDLMQAGVQMGQHIIALLPKGGQIALFIATPGSANIQPRIDGAKQALAAHKNIKYSIVATGASVPGEISAINSWAVGHPSAKGMFAVDGGSTQGVAQAISKNGLKKKGWVGGGFDLTPITEQLLGKGQIQFTIDQQPYLQGFLPILELFLYKASNGLTGPADVDTGLKFVTQQTVKPYTSTKSRFEGTSSKPGVQKA